MPTSEIIPSIIIILPFNWLSCQLLYRWSDGTLGEGRLFSRMLRYLWCLINWFRIDSGEHVNHLMNPLGPHLFAVPNRWWDDTWTERMRQNSRYSNCLAFNCDLIWTDWTSELVLADFWTRRGCACVMKCRESFWFGIRKLIITCP